MSESAVVFDHVWKKFRRGERHDFVGYLRALPEELLTTEVLATPGWSVRDVLAHLVGRLAKEWGIAVLLVEHDMNFVMSVCDELVVLDFGRQIAAGKPADVRNDQAVIAAYLGEQEDDSSGAVGPSPAAVSGTEEH